MTIMGLDSLVEARIERAIEHGDLTDLPGQGRPLPLEDDTCVAPELRLAYRILKNAGFVPEEVEMRREIMLQVSLRPRKQGRAKAAVSGRGLKR